MDGHPAAAREVFWVDVRGGGPTNQNPRITLLRQPRRVRNDREGRIGFSWVSMIGGEVHIPSLCRTQSPKSAIYAETAHSYERDMSGNERAQTTIPREYQVPLRWPIRSSLPPTTSRSSSLVAWNPPILQSSATSRRVMRP